MKTAAKEASVVAMPDPDADPRGYLLANGWTPVEEYRGTIPVEKWGDPLKPEKEITERVQIGTRKDPDGNSLPMFQTQITPSRFAWPCSEDAAVMLQRDRDRAK